jgi:hypothetical protein
VNPYRMASEIVDVLPWKSKLVTFIDVEAGEFSSNIKDKRHMMQLAMEGKQILIAWPGQWSQDVFVIDQPDKVSETLQGRR